ncbi:MAG TPA: ATP-dependent RNA helicase HrpA [Acidimicrobiales bacterium]
METAPTLADLADRLPALTVRDEHELRRRLDRAGRGDGAGTPRAIAAAVEAAERRVAARRALVPVPAYPADLPVAERRDELVAAIRDHQVVIVAGETGSGKSTQLPKMCLEAGRGVRGMVAHTQPRRIAARAVAERVAEELGIEVGDLVGYTVRFTDRVGERTLLRVMTDGILLAEIQRDRLLTRYDTVIVDEAHERSLNIDFLLGYLKQLLPRRPDLKVVITSATIDTVRFAEHFGGAPVVEVSGRTYPVEVRYRPVGDDEDDDRDQVQAICDAVEEVVAEGPGDVLVFLSGEREIRDTADALARCGLRDTEVLPLFGRLSTADQHRVFERHTGRRVVLATNVAETSITVPGIRYVVDPGTARISRYNRRTKVQRLPIEPISQASADQRAGRCGRVGPGICVRLYAEDDYLARPEFTEPEVLRTNLASVILQMTAIGLGDVAAFPFVEPPDARAIGDGVALLEELGALEPGVRRGRPRLTAVGRRLAQLPIDPRLGRMVLEADANGCLAEVTVIAAALAIQDPRERPLGKEQAADQAHARFKGDDSDFLAYLRLWEHLQAAQEERSSSQFRKLCKAEFLHWFRVREWQDVHDQIQRVLRSQGARVNEQPGDPDRVHMSLLAGLLSHIGLRDHRPDRRVKEFVGARNTRFVIAPGSALASRPPQWVMVAELVETNRLWGRVAARIHPSWAERLAQHLVKRSHGEPWWDEDRGAAMVHERVTLYGVPLVEARRVPYARVDPAGARELFLRHALVEGEWTTHHAFVTENAAVVEQVQALEDRVRRDLLVDERARYEFFDRRVPDGVVSTRHFDRWWKDERRRRPDLLTWALADLVDPAAGEVSVDAYPDRWRQGDLSLALTYTFDPGADLDGVTVDVPLPSLLDVRPDGFDWQVPGWREDLVTALIRSLPKDLRRHLVPAAEHARAFLDRAGPADGPLLDVLSRELGRMTGEAVPRAAFSLDAVPPHLRMSFRVVTEHGRPLAWGKDLDALRDHLLARLRPSIARSVAGLERSGLAAWPGGTLPRTATASVGGLALTVYPALVDEGSTVGVRALPSAHEQATAMWAGTRRLVLLAVGAVAPAVERRLRNATRLALASAPYATAAEVLEDCVTCALDGLVDSAGGPAWDEEEFAGLVALARARLVPAAAEVATTVGDVLTAARAVEHRLDALTSDALAPALTDVAVQVARLVHPGFATATGAARLPDVLRYLRAVDLRLDKLPRDPVRDARLMRRVREVEQAYDELRSRQPSPEVLDLRWQVEELRVSLWAQKLGTPAPVSEQRLLREIARLA